MTSRLGFLIISLVCFSYCNAQKAPEGSPGDYFTSKKVNSATRVKNQASSGTCWCFSTTSLVESQCLLHGTELDLSEMYTVRNIYFEKAMNYILRQGHAQFGEGGLGHDEIRAVSLYGAIPESVYSGLPAGQKLHNHLKMDAELKAYVDSLLKARPLPVNWLNGFTAILDKYLGVPPAQFTYSGKQYTPKSFAKEVMNFHADDYVYITSFTHHPYYSNFILEAPDNFANESYYNLPLDEMISVVKQAIDKGFTVMWDADVSNSGFRADIGMAFNLDEKVKYVSADLKPDMTELPFNAEIRQKLYENLTTQDDHLMHITGTERSKDGKTFFIVKNSWGEVGPYKGYMNVSEGYFAINTVSLVVPRAALSKQLLARLKVKP